MQGLRSHAGLVALTVGAFALSVPVVAIAKGPPEDAGGGQNNAGKKPEAEAHVPAPKPAPPGQAKPEPSGRAKGHARTPAGAGDGPEAGAPSPTGGAHTGGAPKEHRPPAPHAGTPPGHAHVAPGHAKRGSHSPAEGSSEPPSSSGEVAPSAGSPDAPSGGSPDAPSGGHSAPEPTGALDLPSARSRGGGGGVAGAVADEAVELPEDASPATLPFTGLQLVLLALIGLGTAVGGVLVRQRV
jgi:hypothetical protein